MNMELLSRIEDQAIDKFNKTFRTDRKTGAITQAEMYEIFIKWMDFWISEKTISKYPNPVVDMKNHVCDLRIGFIMDKARKYKMEEALKAKYQTLCKF